MDRSWLASIQLSVARLHSLAVFGPKRLRRSVFASPSRSTQGEVLLLGKSVTVSNTMEVSELRNAFDKSYSSL